MNTEILQLIIAIIISFPPSFIAWLSYRKGQQNAKSIQDVHVSINSRMDELLKTTKAAAFAEGRKIQKDSVHD